MARALEFCGTQPSACPQTPQLTCQLKTKGLEGPLGKGGNPSLTALSAPRTIADLLLGNGLKVLQSPGLVLS